MQDVRTYVPCTVCPTHTTHTHSTHNAHTVHTTHTQYTQHKHTPTHTRLGTLEGWYGWMEKRGVVPAMYVRTLLCPACHALPHLWSPQFFVLCCRLSIAGQHGFNNNAEQMRVRLRPTAFCAVADVYCTAPLATTLHIAACHCALFYVLRICLLP